MQAGDGVVICDAGGAKTNVHTYEIVSPSPLQLKELVRPIGIGLTRHHETLLTFLKGGWCGSLGLNKRFEEAIFEVIGQDQYYRLQKTSGFEAAKRQFDQVIKPSFTGDPLERFYVNFLGADLQDDPIAHITHNLWELERCVRRRNICDMAITLLVSLYETYSNRSSST